MSQKYYKYHEEETLYLLSKESISLSALREVLSLLNFEEMDDFFFLDRVDSHSEWQSSSLAFIEVFDNAKMLALINDDKWNKLSISYLFATIPFQFSEEFLNIAYHIAAKFNLSVEHNGVICTQSDMTLLFHEYREDVRSALDGEPGSEIARINIAISYPR